MTGSFIVEMDFVIEKISEDSFYINLLLGIPKVLESLGIYEYNLSRQSALLEPDISHWEHKHGVSLPEDLRDFYCSTNGFLFEWYYSFKEDDEEDTNARVQEKASGNDLKPIVGKIEVNPLENLRQIFGYVTTNEPCIIKKEPLWEINLSLESKIFEICSVTGAKVVLVYLLPKTQPSIWLFTSLMQFCYLSQDFRTYFKMCIAHLGIPNWQYVFAPEGISECTKSLFRLLTPHLLPEVKQKSPKKALKSKDSLTAVPANKLDPAIFKPRQPQSSLHPKNEGSESSGQQIADRDNKCHHMLKKHPPSLKFQRKPLYYIKKKH